MHPIKLRRRKRPNLRTRFLIVFVALVTVLTVLIAVAAGYRFVADMERLIEQNGQAMAEILAREAFLKVVIEQETNVAFLVESFASGEVIFAQIVHNGKIVAEKKLFDLDLPVRPLLPGPHTFRGVLADGTAYIDISHSFEGRISATDTGLRQDLVDSYVRLGFSFGKVHQEIQSTVLGVVSISLVAILLGFALIWAYYQRAWKPLEHLHFAMLRFGQGQTQMRAQVHSGDELETLAHSFNRMADSIVRKDDQMTQVNRELQQANRAKSDFLAAMSHDLKTPLHVISGFAQLMLEGDGGALSQVQRSHLQSILRSADRLLEFIDRILSFAKLESGRESLQLETLNVPVLTQDVVHPLQALASRKGLALSCSVPQDVLPLRADAAKLRRILSNLVENAIKYTEAGRVEVSVAAQARGVVWQVQDTGPGIAAEHQRFILDTELAGAESEVTKANGTGWQTSEQWQKLYATLQEFGAIQGGPEAPVAFSTAALEAIHDDGTLVWP